jgi:AcrR family transcriptional regulator
MNKCGRDDMALAKRKSSKRRTGDESRQRILAAASDVFAEHGFEKTTIRAVAGRAGISVGGIYLYFHNKEELYTGLMRSQMDEFLGRVELLRTEVPLRALRKLIELYMEIAVTKTRMLSTSIKEYDLEFKRPIRDAFFRTQHRIIANVLAKGMHDGSFRSMDCGAMALMILVTLRGAILGYLTGDIRRPKEYGKTLYEFFMNGIRSNTHA